MSISRAVVATALALASFGSSAAGYYVRENMINPAPLVNGVTEHGASVGDSNGYRAGSVDLREGSLKNVVQATNQDATIAAWVDFGDTIYIAGLIRPTEIAIEVRVEGSFSGNVNYAQMYLIVGQALVCGSSNCNVSNAHASGQLFWAGPPPTPNVDETLRVSWIAVPESPSFAFSAQLQSAATGPDGHVALGNTARLSLDLPDELTFTSASGVFLTPVVPEPSTLLLSVTGIAALLLTMRRWGKLNQLRPTRVGCSG